MAGVDIDGKTISSSSGGLSIADSLRFNSQGRSVGSLVGADKGITGFSGRKSIAGDTLQYTQGNGWPVNVFDFNDGQMQGSILGYVFLNFVPGFYVFCFNGIVHGSSMGTPATHGHFGFAKNGVVIAWNHMNLSSSNTWQSGGITQVVRLESGDSVKLWVNGLPKADYNTAAAANNYGFYPADHHQVWAMRIGA